MWTISGLSIVADRSLVGHTKVRCKAPSKETGDDPGASAGGEAMANTGGDDFDTPAAAGGGDGWETKGKPEANSWEAAPAVSAGGGW